VRQPVLDGSIRGALMTLIMPWDHNADVHVVGKELGMFAKRGT
jgi:hypothetical protein